MMISSGMAEIQFNRTSSAEGPAKIYLWPNYNNGRVEKIDRLDRYDRDIVYFKPNKEEKENLLNAFRQNREPLYTKSGMLGSNTNFLAPGSLFTAIV